MKKYIYFLIVILLPVLAACPNPDPVNEHNGVAITGEVTEIWATSATIGGMVNLDAIGTAYSSVDYGVEYSTNQSFQDIIRVSAKEQTGSSFSVQLSKLNPETKYYYRTYLRSGSSQNYHGEIKSFTTNSVAVTGDAIEIGSMTAEIDGTVNLDQNTSATVYVEYSTQSSFQQSNEVQVNKPTGRTFSVKLTALQSETKYYYRTGVKFWVSNKQQTYLGEAKTFTTKKLSEAEMYVDLALPSGTLWATMNIGAKSPAGVGDEFAWGETAPKNTYDWHTYKWCNGTYKTLTKYCTDSYYGTVDNKTELDLEDDAAYVNWGPEWRIPSREQIIELKNGCTSEKVTLNGVSGLLLTSKKNGATLFLPAVRCWSRDGAYSDYKASYMYVWDGELTWSSADRYYGYSVRPVRVSNN